MMRIVDAVVFVFVYFAGLLLRAVRAVGLRRMPLSRRMLLAAGLLPVRKHYYDPFPDLPGLERRHGEPRALPGIEWNVGGQLALLGRIGVEGELGRLGEAPGELAFRFGNGNFEAGDAEFLYAMVRLYRPARVFEVGSGHSTRLVAQAIAANRAEAPDYRCKHLCIEPYEAPWLERLGATVVRRRVEELGVATFAELERGDLLFVDSSHVIRPRGDVLFELLELLPALRPGVIVHLHDIFSPADYPREWLVDDLKLWNEQYLFEAFLSNNREWRVLAALNYLRHHHFDALRAKCPHLRAGHEPGSFYIEKVA